MVTSCLKTRHDGPGAGGDREREQCHPDPRGQASLAHSAGETPAPGRTSTPPFLTFQQKGTWHTRYNAGGAAVLRAQRPWERTDETNACVRNGRTISRWRRSKTAADSAVIPACDALRRLCVFASLRFNAMSSCLRAFVVATMRWMRCLCVPLCLCASVA